MASPYGWPAKSFIEHVPANIQVNLSFIAVAVFILPVLISGIIYLKIIQTRSSCWRNKVGFFNKDSNGGASNQDIEYSVSVPSFGGVYIGQDPVVNLEAPKISENANRHKAISVVHSCPQNTEIVLNPHTLSNTLPEAKINAVKASKSLTMDLSKTTNSNFDKKSENDFTMVVGCSQGADHCQGETSGFKVAAHHNEARRHDEVRHLDEVQPFDEPVIQKVEELECETERYRKADEETDGARKEKPETETVLGSNEDMDSEGDQRTKRRRNAEAKRNGEPGREASDARDQNEIIVLSQEPKTFPQNADVDGGNNLKNNFNQFLRQNVLSKLSIQELSFFIFIF